MKKTYLLSANGCPACEVLKHKLADKIKSGEIRVINMSSDRNFHLVKKLEIQFVPEIVTVNQNDNGTFSVRRENEKTYKLDRWPA